jgi:hypothetical protein
MEVTKTVLERMENNMLKWYGHVGLLCMEDNRRRKILRHVKELLKSHRDE